MSALFVYLIKVNIALIVFCLGYYLVLRPLTFYVLNRVYLVGAILFATLYPLIDFEAILNRHQEIAQPVQIIVLNWQAPVVNAVQQVQHDKWFWLALVFWAGVGVLAVRFIMQLLSLYKLHRQSKPVQLHQYFIRVISGDVNPFSFWKSIYINPENHQPEELKAILAHEQVHVSQWHTIDILLGEISTIFYWFNPGVWLMKRAIRENIEFITDQKILQSGSDPKAYQYSLLNVSFNGGHNAIVNHFNTSTIKKRIMMMNTKRSSTLNLTRYALLVPAVVALVLVFSVSKAEFKKQVTKSNAAIAEAFTTVIEKIEPVTDNIAVVAKRGVSFLPDAVHVLFTDTARKVTPVKYNYNLTYDTTGRGQYRLHVSIDTSYGRSYSFRADSSFADTSKKYKEVVVTGYKIPAVSGLSGLYPNPKDTKSFLVKGDAISPDGNIYFNGEPVKKAMINGVVISSPHKMTPAEMEKLKQAGTATILPGGIIDVSQQKITKVKINGVEVTSASNPVNLNSIRADDVQKISIDNDGVVNVSGKNITYNNVPVKTTQGFTYNPNVINIKRPVDSTKKPLIIVNGIPGGDINDIDLNDVEAINVLKDGSAAHYGKGAENGVIVITTKKGKSGKKPVTVTGQAITIRERPLTFNSAYSRLNNSLSGSPNIFAGKLLIVNGKEMSQQEFSKIPADKIEVIKKGGAKELKKYGDKAKNGVLIITTTR